MGQVLDGNARVDRGGAPGGRRPSLASSTHRSVSSPVDSYDSRWDLVVRTLLVVAIVGSTVSIVIGLFNVVTAGAAEPHDGEDHECPGARPHLLSRGW